MTLADLKNKIEKDLSPQVATSERRVYFHALLEHVAHVPPYWAFTQPHYVLEPATAYLLEQYIARLAVHEPLQYVLGLVEFGPCVLHVDERVLIPRPETQELLERLPDAAVVLDACTGSGALAVAYAYRHSQAAVFACDISQPALEVARENAHRNKASVTFFACDVTDTPHALQAAVAAGVPSGLVDVLVSNPPYVREAEKALMHPRVLDYEPSLALFVPDHRALLFYEALALMGQSLLRPGGRLLVEINEAFGPAVVDLFAVCDYGPVSLYQDLNGKDRFVEAYKNAGGAYNEKKKYVSLYRNDDNNDYI